MEKFGSRRVHILVAVVGLATVSETCSGAEPELAAYYGFLPVEIFNVSQRSAHLLAGDLNSDGKTDLLLADNSHSRLDLFVQRDADALPEVPAERSATVNEIVSDGRYEHRKLPVDREITSLTLGDFNGDRRLDIAYFGAPDRLVVRFQPESGEWTERRSWRLPAVSPRAWSIASGDLNSDGRDDLAVLGEKVTYIMLQHADGLPAAPRVMMNTSDKLALLRIADFDGDERNDLIYLTGDDPEHALCARLQSSSGQLGPEFRFEFAPPRGFTVQDLDENPGVELLAIAARSGRAQVSAYTPPPATADEWEGRLVQFGFGSGGSSRDRDLAVGDVDGDGLADVVVTDPEAAQMMLFPQTRGRGLSESRLFPGLSGAEQVRIADVDADGLAEVIVMSSKERTIGLSQFHDGRLQFPQPLPIAGEPAAVDIIDLDGDGVPEVAYLFRERTGRETSYALAALQYHADGGWQNFRFSSDQKQVSVELNAAPKRLVSLDANRDGRKDLLVFLEFDKPPQLFLVDNSGTPISVPDAAGGGLGNVSFGSVFAVDGSNPLVLAAQNNFARNLQHDALQRWTVLDQYNASEANARIAGVAALDLDGEEGREIVLVDPGVRKLRVLRREDNLYRPWREVEMGTFPYLASFVADLDGNAKDDLLLFGEGKFGVLYAQRPEPTVEEVTSYDPPTEKVHYTDLAAGDLNSDGHSDVVVVDTRGHQISILQWRAEMGLREAITFQIFEEKSFSSSRGSGSEPRESLITDVTGDGRNDLVLLAHDRLLVYPQDGRAEP